MKKKPFNKFSKFAGKKKFLKTKGGKPIKPRTGSGGSFFRKKFCKFCAEKITAVDYKDVGRLQKLITERGKITPSRLSGLCATHQRMLATAINRARHIALLPYSARY